MPVPIVIASGALAYNWRATMQFAGGGAPGLPSFAADNLLDPGNMTIPIIGPFMPKITAMIGASVNTAYAGSVALTCTAIVPAGPAPSIIVDGIADDPLTGWTLGVCTNVVELFLPAAAMYTFELDDGVTISSFNVEGLP